MMYINFEKRLFLLSLVVILCLYPTDNKAQKIDSVTYWYQKADSVMNFDFNLSNYYLDQVDRILKGKKENLKQAKSYILRGILYNNYDHFDKSLQYYSFAEPLVVSEKDTLLLVQLLMNKAATIRFLDSDENVIKIFDQVLAVCDSTNKIFYQAIAGASLMKGVALTKLNKENAITYFLQAEEYATINKDYEKLGAIHYEMAKLYKKRYNWDKVIDECKKADSFYPKDDLNRQSLNKLLGDAYNAKGDIVNAEKIYLNILSIKNLTNRSKVFALNSLGIFYNENSQFLKAKKHLKEGIRYCTTNDLYKKKAELLANLGKAYYELKDINKSLQCYDEAKKIFFDPNSNTSLEHKVILMEEYTRALINAPNALTSFDNFIILRDSLHNEDSKGIAEEYLIKYESTKKEAENQLLLKDKALNEAKISKQNNLLLTSLLALSSLLFGFFMLMKRNKERSIHIQELSSKNKKIEALNRETIHRTKNYLNLATSLLSKTKIDSNDVKVMKALEENEKRLKVLSLVNHKLTGENDKGIIGLKTYLSELVDDLEFSFKDINNIPLKIISDVDEIELDSDKSLYIGLIVNELIVNTVKHAKSNGTRLEVKLRVLKTMEGLHLLYSDNGSRLDKMGKIDNQGLGLIGDLVSQLAGSFTLDNEKGFQFTMTMGNS